MQEVSELREEVKNLRMEIERLRKGTDARLSEAYKNQKHLLEMIKDLKEELDVDKVKRASSSSPASSARSEVKATQQIVTCLGFPCMDTTCLKHYTAEGVCMTLGQAARARGRVTGRTR